MSLVIKVLIKYKVLIEVILIGCVRKKTEGIIGDEPGVFRSDCQWMCIQSVFFKAAG